MTPTSAGDFLRALDHARRLMVAFESPEAAPRLLRAVPDAQFRLMVQATAELLKELKTEAIRRGVWDELKGHTVGRR